MDAVARCLAALADPVRLRAVRVLASRELASGDLAKVLDVAPSTLSKHVVRLREAGLVDERRDGKRVYLRVRPDAVRDARWGGLLTAVASGADESGDDARLRDLLRAREEEHADPAARDGRRTRRDYAPGKSWRAWSRGLTFLVPRGLRVLDLGCGDGRLTVEIARFAASVVGIDRDARGVRAARALARARGASHATFRTGDVLRAAVPAAAFDLVVVSHLLQQLGEGEDRRALAVAAQALAPGGRVLVLDLETHAQEWAVRRLGHRRLGYAADEARALLVGAGFADVAVETVSGGRDDPFRVFAATGVLPAAARARVRA